MAREVYRIDIPIEVEDRYSDELRKAEKDVKDFEKTSKKAGQAGKDIGDGAKAAAAGMENVGKSSRKASGEVTKFQKSMDGTKKKLSAMSKSKFEMILRAKDNASRVVRGVNNFVQRMAGRSYSFTVRAVDRASRVLGGIRRTITSIPTVITVALAYVGVKNLGEATLGAAMNFEDYGVAMEHWLKGNTKQAEELIGWMGRFADKTPFNSADLFPALSRGVGISGGDVRKAQQLLELSADMTALTPGKTVSDAMEALADANMGEFERLKEFNMKMTKDEYKAIGGWDGLIKRMSKTFDGGAEKLSQTARGKLATLRGYMGTQFRSMGEGVLEAMKPRIDMVTGWLDDNQEKWGQWKNFLVRTGGEAGEWVFSKLETGFEHIRKNYLENEDFHNMSFEAKVDFVMADIKQWWSSKGKPALDSWWEGTGKPWAVDTGQLMGEAILAGMITGAKEGLSSIGEMWKEAFEEPSAGKFGGAATATLLAGGIGSMLLAPVLRGAGTLYKGGKWAGGLFTRGKKTPAPPPPPAPSGKAPVSAPPANRPIILDQYGKPLPPSGSAPASQPRPIPTPIVPPKETKAPKWFNPKSWKTPEWIKPKKWNAPDWIKPTNWKAPTWLSKVSKFGSRIPWLGTLFGAAAIASAPEGEKAGVAGGWGGALAGGALGAKGGALIGSVVPGIGTAIGGVAGGLLGGIGGAIGGEKLMNWLFKPKKATAAESASSGSAPTSSASVSSAGTIDLSAIQSAMQAEMNLVRSNIKRLADWIGQASGWIVGAFQPLQGSTEVIRHNLSVLTQYLGQASGWVVQTFMPLSNNGTVLGHNLTVLNDYVGQASGWVVGAFQPLSSNGAVLGANVGILSMYVGQASGWIVGAFMPVAQNGAILSQNMSVLNMYLGMASGFVVGAFYPLAGTGALLNHNTTVLAGYLGQSSGMVVGAFFPLAGKGPLLNQNASALAANLGMASGWVASLYGIQSGAAQVKAALSGLAARINSTPAPSMGGVTRSAARSSRPVAYANGGVVNRPHFGLVGEAGPEAIIPLSSGRRSRAMELYEKTGRLLGVQRYANGAFVGANVANIEPMVPDVAGGGTTSARAGNTVISMGGVHVSASVSVTVDGGDADAAVEISEELVDEVGIRLAPKIREALGNMF